MSFYAQIDVPFDRIAALCRASGISELALFGSSVREDFGPDSDVDVLVTFAAEARPTLLDIVRIENALSELFGRPTDLVERRAVERSRNHVRREAILRSTRTIYAG
ncbi:nucleotidyltransferase family protein [Candidatus Palauibacter sp.]|uniref:nucleotidyltransferase family protein n=1 Tax=Candidatus Palauibacter sp. TaxID=3101350 RepID=UPI003B015EB4